MAQAVAVIRYSLRMLLAHAPCISRLLRRIRHVSGPRKIPSGGVTLITRVRDGAYYVPSFLAHYRGLGVTHMLFLDNGSIDDTLEMLASEPDVTAYRTELSFGTHGRWMNRWLFTQCPKGSWVLSADMDEFFEYPHADAVPLPALAAMLDTEGATAMRALLLDCFASGPIGSEEKPAPAPVPERFPWYDVSHITRLPPGPAFGDVPAYAGGIRSQVCGYHHFCLTKHPFLKRMRGVDPWRQSSHVVEGARLSAMTGVLRHCKFFPGFRAYVASSVVEGQHWNASHEYVLYAQALARDPHLSIKRDTAERWRGIGALVDAGLVADS